MGISIMIFGGSRGIGKILADHYILHGVPVSITARHKPDHGTFNERTGAASRINLVQADIGNEQEVQAAFDQHHACFGSVPDVVINTAAIQEPIGSLWTLSSQEWFSNIRTNLYGSYLVVKHAVQAMMKRKTGSIILFSGGGAAFARPQFSAYGVAKTGVLRLVENACEELNAAGLPDIVVNAIAPGAVKTGMMDEILKHSGTISEKERQDAETTIRTGGTAPEQIIALVEFLCSEGARHRFSGRLVHVREDYRNYLARHGNNVPSEAGKLRRVPLS